MKNLFEYSEGNGIIHRINPLAKMAALVAFWSLVFSCEGFYLLLPASIIFLLAGEARILGRFMAQTKFFFMFLFPFIIISQILFTHELGETYPSLLGINLNLSEEAVIRGTHIGLRLFCLFSSSLLFMITTNTFKLIDSAGKISILGLRIPPNLLFFLAFVNRSASLILCDLETILDAQKARGFSLKEGGIRERIRGYVALLTPLITISLERAQKQAISLELKGFGSKVSKRDIKKQS